MTDTTKQIHDLLRSSRFRRFFVIIPRPVGLRTADLLTGDTGVCLQAHEWLAPSPVASSRDLKPASLTVNVFDKLSNGWRPRCLVNFAPILLPNLLTRLAASTVGSGAANIVLGQAIGTPPSFVRAFIWW